MSHRARSILVWIGQTFAIVVLAGLLGLMAFGYGAAAGGEAYGISLRTVIALLILGFTLAIARKHWRRSSLGFHLSSAAVAYILLPLTWTGNALFSAALVDTPWLSAVLDGVLWLLVAAGVTTVQAGRHPATEDDYGDRMDWAR